MFDINRIWKAANMRERRKNFRVEWNSSAKMYDCEGHFIARCIVSNFSNTGAKIAGVNPDVAPEKFILCIFSPRGRAQECHVVWRSKNSFGVEFAGSAKRMNAPQLRDRQKARLSV